MCTAGTYVGFAQKGGGQAAEVYGGLRIAPLQSQKPFGFAPLFSGRCPLTKKDLGAPLATGTPLAIDLGP